MSFKNLEDRFNQRVNTLYAGATLKFDGGKPSNGKFDDPLIVRSPTKGYWSARESRALPINSTREDVKRITLFTLSRSGLLFLAKQQLLQTGNTFEITRVINPAFTVANAVPFLHVRRHLRPLRNLLGKTDTSYSNIKKLGQLQVSTYNGFTSKYSNPDTLPDFYRYVLKLPDPEKQKFNPFKSIYSQVKSRASAFANQIKRSIGDELGLSFDMSRPESISILPIVTQNNKQWQDNTRKYFGIAKQQPTQQNNPTGFKDTLKRSLERGLTELNNSNPIPFLQYFEGDTQSIRSDSQGTTVDGVKVLNALNLAGGDANTRQYKSGNKISYIKDPANITGSVLKTLTPYKDVNSGFNDIIDVKFRMGGDEDAIKFRAFLKDFTQTVTPEYKEYKYVGRNERFVMYNGTKRAVSFKLGLLAFSKTELDVVWKRLNYLTGLAYPYGFKNGIYQPNILRFTLGDVFKDQPAYIDGAIDMNFNDIVESWEIDAGKQVPIGAQVSMKLMLIEKYTRIAESPFYAITENMKNKDGNPVFKQPLVTQESPPTNTQTAKETVEVSGRGDVKTDALNRNARISQAAQTAANVLTGLGR